MLNTSKFASVVDVLAPNQANHKKIQDIISKLAPRGANPKIAPLLVTLNDFVAGAPSPYMAVAYDSSHKMIGALTFLDDKDEYEIRSLGIVAGADTARSLMRSLNHNKTLLVSAQPTEHDLYRSLGFIHSEELDDKGGPSQLMLPAPGRLATAAIFHERGWITPAGKFIPVVGVVNTNDLKASLGTTPTMTDKFRDAQHHWTVASDFFGLDIKDWDEAYQAMDKAFEEGWSMVRLNGNHADITFSVTDCTSAQFDTLWKYIAKHQPSVISMSNENRSVEGSLHLSEFLSCNSFIKLKRALRGTKVASSDIIKRAYEFAKQAHEAVGQKRKYSGEPYIVHPEGVVGILMEHGHMSDNMLAAAYLHDTVEDTAVTIEDIDREFGPEISALVGMLTDTAKPEDGNRATRMGINRAHAAQGSPDAQTIKLADILHNIRDVAVQDPKWAMGKNGYIAEKEAVVEALTGADPKLRDYARAEILRIKGELGMKTGAIQQPSEVPAIRIGETLWRALAFTDATRRLVSIEAGSKLRSMHEVENLESKVAELSRHPINKPDMDAQRVELIQTAKSYLTEGQLKRVRVGRMAEWSRAGRKLLPFLPENLKQALLTWGTAHSGYRKFAATLSDLYCTNPDCTDFEKRGHGNLTQEFAYGVDSDRHMIYCATCKKRFSETKCTEFFGAKLNGDDIAHILEKTVEGKSIRDIADELDLNKDSVNNVILKAKEICEKYVSGDKANVSKDALGDMNLEKGQKGKLSDFITEVVIPELTEEEDEGEEDEPKADE